MEKIDLKEIILKIKNLLSQKTTLIITAFKEPKIEETIKSALNQKTKYPYEIIISVPDDETIEKIQKIKNSKIKIIKDPGKGKSYALNLLFSKIKTDILILTDGDVLIDENSVEDILNLFQDPEIGCVTGRPFPIENKTTKYGYWANFLFDAAHQIRKKLLEKNSFIECSGYLFAFRKNKIKEIPLDVAEDTVIPYIFWQKGYKIGYAEKAKVYVKNAQNIKDWIKQKTRTHKAHEKLEKYVDTKTTPKVKTFKTESKGIISLMKYPSNLKEFNWTFQLIIARLYTWLIYFKDTQIIRKQYQDSWERIESTK